MLTANRIYSIIKLKKKTNYRRKSNENDIKTDSNNAIGGNTDLSYCLRSS